MPFKKGNKFGKRFQIGNHPKTEYKPGFKNPQTPEQLSINGRKGGLKGCQKTGFKPGHEYGLKAIKSRAENSPYYWEGPDFKVGFLSKEELLCAQKILSKPVIGINCHIQIDRYQIDFLPQPFDKMLIGNFVEYHPCTTVYEPRTLPEYYMDRWMIIQNSKYKDTPLTVITSLSELNRSSF